MAKRDTTDATDGARSGPVMAPGNGPPGESPAPTLLGGQRVLVVDDNVGTSTLLVGALQDAGATVDVSRSADAAAAQALRRPPAVVVIHLPLPKDAAATLSQRLKRHPPLAEVAVVILSGDDGLEEAQASAADLWQTRPMSLQRLVEDVARLMHSRR